MKRILFLVMIASLLFSQGYSQNKISNQFSGTTAIDWDYTIRDGDTTSLTEGQDTLSVLGASDTLVSRYFSQWGGDMSIQLDIQGGTTVDIYFALESANKSSYFADSSFARFAYLESEGLGVNDNYFTGDSVSIGQTGITGHILVPPLGGDVFRLKVYSSASQSGNSLIKAILKRTKL